MTWSRKFAAGPLSRRVKMIYKLISLSCYCVSRQQTPSAETFYLSEAAFLPLSYYNPLSERRILRQKLSLFVSLGSDCLTKQKPHCQLQSHADTELSSTRSQKWQSPLHQHGSFVRSYLREVLVFRLGAQRTLTVKVMTLFPERAFLAREESSKRIVWTLDQRLSPGTGLRGICGL
ncbi:hypothetical protein BaRGS_00001747 [Batillaria attramentaria]|uniref:Uncharacterized protein n=1 Tax=Batillaria attramentaria TaxID=370345 RepID=A0ABD0M6A9_9CAEN